MSNFVLNKGQLNNVVVTVSERSELIDPFYLVVFNSKFDTDGDTTSLSVQDVSPSKIRYNLFEITETSGADPLNAEVYFPDSGEWNYKIYESATQTLDVDETTGEILQRGLVIVKE